MTSEQSLTQLRGSRATEGPLGPQAGSCPSPDRGPLLEFTPSFELRPVRVDVGDWLPSTSQIPVSAGITWGPRRGQGICIFNNPRR